MNQNLAATQLGSDSPVRHPPPAINILVFSLSYTMVYQTPGYEWYISLFTFLHDGLSTLRCIPQHEKARDRKSGVCTGTVLGKHSTITLGFLALDLQPVVNEKPVRRLALKAKILQGREEPGVQVWSYTMA